MIRDSCRRRVYYGIWHNVHEKKEPILNNHLALLLPSTLDEKNLRLINSGKKEKYQLWDQPDDGVQHAWVYFPRMGLNEALVWKHSDDAMYKDDPVGGAVFHTSVNTAKRAE